ncbi:MAG TPA: glycosyltransferase family 4 protein [Candidatus Acidoferrales bacterium]
MSPRRATLAVVSPFIDKRHGTERQVAEWISQLLEDFEVHVYSQRVEDMELTKLRWHRIPEIPGPHLLNFSWWFVANHLWRWWDRRVRNIAYDLVYTPGTNCLDADAISVHIVFAEFLRQMGQEISFRRNSIRSWPWLIHRRLYYSVVKFLERKLYTKPRAQLIVYARKTENDLNRFYGPHDPVPVVYIGVDHKTFSRESRLARRSEARRELGIGDGQIVLLLVGNDWRKKGLFTLLEALVGLADLPVLLLVAGNDERYSYESLIIKLGLTGRVRFLPSRQDVAFYYAAADAYVGPSIEDTFALPPEEAMACGLPVITTITNGTSEIMTDGVDGFILNDPNDVQTLASKIRLLCENEELRQRIGEAAAETTKKYTWERNGQQFREIFAEILRRKQNPKATTVHRAS